MFQGPKPTSLKEPTYSEMAVAAIYFASSVAFFIAFLIKTINDDSFYCAHATGLLVLTILIALVDNFMFLSLCYKFLKFKRAGYTTPCYKSRLRIFLPNFWFTITHYPLQIVAFAVSIVAYKNRSCGNLSPLFLAYIITTAVQLMIMLIPLVFVPLYNCCCNCNYHCDARKNGKWLFTPAAAPPPVPQMVQVPMDNMGRAQAPPPLIIPDRSPMRWPNRKSLSPQDTEPAAVNVVVLDRSPTKVNQKGQEETPLSHFFS
jgi:hypothetical protein